MTSRSSPRSLWRALAAAALVAAAAVFLGLTVARNWQQLSEFDWRFRWVHLVGSVVALTAVFAWGVYVWKRVLDRFEHPPISLAALLRIWFASNLARYIPGKVWQFVGAAGLARSAGLSRVVILSSLVVHAGFSLLSAAVVGALALSWWDVGSLPRLPLLVLAVASVFLVHPAVLNTGLRLVPGSLRDTVLHWRGSWADGLILLALSVVSWVLYGAAFTLFVQSLAPQPAGVLIPLTGINALSFLFGYLVFLAPAGLGAREGAMAVLLRPFVPAGVAAIVAMASRLWTIAAELLGVAIVLVLTRPPEHERPGADDAGPRRNGG